LSKREGWITIAIHRSQAKKIRKLGLKPTPFAVEAVNELLAKIREKKPQEVKAA
jgi:hypothetical protein